MNFNTPGLRPDPGDRETGGDWNSMNGWNDGMKNSAQNKTSLLGTQRQAVCNQVSRSKEKATFMVCLYIVEQDGDETGAIKSRVFSP